MLLGEWVSLAFFFVIIAWLSCLTLWIYKTVNHYKRLVKGSQGADLRNVLERLINSQEKFDEQLKKLDSQVLYLGRQSQFPIQKVGIVRFSPYSNTGGNQSFALALLNMEDTGVVLLSLHNREGTRIYIKPVVKGSSQLELSSEEKRAIDDARRRRIN